MVAEGSGLSLEFRIVAFVVTFIVELLGLAGLVLVVGSFEAFDAMTLLVTLELFVFVAVNTLLVEVLASGVVFAVLEQVLASC